jgi:uncharacterized membrane protein YraQ (UPF0718 family)
MIEIISQIVISLIGAILIGFAIGYLFARSLEKKHDSILEDIQKLDTNRLDLTQDEKNKQIIELKSKYEQEQKLLKKCKDKNRHLKGQLLQKINLLEKTSKTLKDMQTRQCKEEKNKILELEKLLKKKEAELKEFESVLVKAEKTIEALMRGES